MNNDSYLSALSIVLREGLLRTIEVSVFSFLIAVVGGVLLERCAPSATKRSTSSLSPMSK